MRRGQRGSDNPDTVEYDIEYEYDQLGNRTLKTDHVAERMTVYSYDVDCDPATLDYPTHHNRLLWYELYDISDPNAAALLRTVRYTYYDTGQASNITVTDEVLDPNGNQWHHDLALHYYTHGPLRLAVWGRWLEDQTGPHSYEVLKAKEFRYDDPRARYIAADIATPTNSTTSWTLDGDPLWTDYEGVSPYADCDVNPETADVSDQHNRYFGLSGHQDLDPKGTPTASSYWHEDLNGSTMQTTNTGGTSASSASYNAFGEPIGNVNNMPRYQYAGAYGYESDLLAIAGADVSLPALGLKHLGWRWYQADTGRFIQRDPLGVLGELCVYSYPLDPVAFVDPTGLKWEKDRSGQWKWRDPDGKYGRAPWYWPKPGIAGRLVRKVKVITPYGLGSGAAAAGHRLAGKPYEDPLDVAGETLYWLCILAKNEGSNARGA